MICDKRAVAVISNNYLPLQQTNVWFWNHSQTSVHATPKRGGICPHDFEKPRILRSPENDKTIQMIEGRFSHPNHICITCNMLIKVKQIFQFYQSMILCGRPLQLENHQPRCLDMLKKMDHHLIILSIFRTAAACGDENNANPTCSLLGLEPIKSVAVIRCNLIRHYLVGSLF